MASRDAKRTVKPGKNLGMEHVKHVLRCQLIAGRPEMHGGQTATAEEIRAFCKGQIAHYKIPRYVEFVAEFPMTITGKIQKFVMREETIEKLGLKAQKTA